MDDWLFQPQEDLDGLVLSHSEFVVKPCGVLCALLGPLPKLPRVIARERNDVFLGKVAEDGVALLDELVRAERTAMSTLQSSHSIQAPL